MVKQFICRKYFEVCTSHSLQSPAMQTFVTIITHILLINNMGDNQDIICTTTQENDEPRPHYELVVIVIKCGKMASTFL